MVTGFALASILDEDAARIQDYLGTYYTHILNHVGLIRSSLGRIESLIETQTRHLKLLVNTAGSYFFMVRVSGTFHDTLKSIAAKPTRDTQHANQKAKALQIWRSGGAYMGLKEGISVVTLRRVSQLSDEERYWKIPKQCFWMACPCSSQASHPVSVCKGCWRVLYCSTKCQRS